MTAFSEREIGEVKPVVEGSEMQVSAPYTGNWIKCSSRTNIYMPYVEIIGLKRTSVLVTLAGFVAPERCVSEHDVTVPSAVT